MTQQQKQKKKNTNPIKSTPFEKGDIPGTVVHPCYLACQSSFRPQVFEPDQKCTLECRVVAAHPTVQALTAPSPALNSVLGFVVVLFCMCLCESCFPLLQSVCRSSVFM